MKKHLSLFASTLVISLLSPNFGQASLDNQGKEFLMTFLPNLDETVVVELHLTSDVKTTVSVVYPANSPFFTKDVTVVPGNITVVNLPVAALHWSAGSVQNNVVRAYSEDEFITYMINRRPASSDAALALPVDTMNTEYLVTTYEPDMSFETPEFAVVAANDNTAVTITPPTGSPSTVRLNRGEGYLVQGSTDLTGTKISADKPIGMTNGNKCVNYDGSACDHVFEVAPPVQAWGKEIPVANLPETSLGVRYKILASRDNTVVVQDGTAIGTINAGKYILTNRLPGDHIFSSEQPIFVAQFMANRASSGGNPIGDPAMGNMTPAEQYKTNYTFSTVGGSQFIEHNVTIIAQSSDVGTLLLDGSPVSASKFTQIGSSDYWVARPYLTEGVHSTSSAHPHGITVEGFNSYDSYLYTGGAMFKFINPIGDANPPICSFNNATKTGSATDNRPSEDANGNDVLDPGEDLNGNGLIDKDTGIYSVKLADGAANLTLTVDPFTPGDGTASFSAALADSAGVDGVGSIIVTDGAGNACQAPVEIINNKPPVAKCKDIQASLDANGNVTISPADIDNGSYDSDSGDHISLSISKSKFTCSDVGVQNLIALTVTDDSGESDSCISKVTTVDKVAPVVRTKSITVQLDASGKASISAPDVDNGSADNCCIASRSISKSSFTCADVGQQAVTLTVTDCNGNSSSATARVTVQDKVAPIVKTKNVTVQLDASGKASISAPDVDGGSTDNCCIASKSVSKSSFTCADVGQQAVTLTVTDCNGNSSSATANVTVQDKVAPVVKTKNVTVQLDASGKASISAPDVDGGSTDNCCIASKSVSKSSFTCADVGQQAVTLTVTDCNGNSSSATANVTVQDKVAPVVKTKNVTVQLDAEGKAAIVGSDVDGGTTDACGIASLAVDPLRFTCSNLGTNTVTLTATDKNGNAASAAATVTVADTLAPTNVQANAPATITPPDAPISFKATATDNCSAAVKITDYFCYKVKKDGSQQSKMESCVVNVSGDTLTIANSGGVGDNIIWTVLATDQSGNTATAKGSVLVANPSNDGSKGNNGVGNGQDPQPPGNPPVNDGAGSSPGNPGNKKK